MLAALVASCAHRPSPGPDSLKKAEWAETYPITGIPFTEFESLVRDIRDQIPLNAAILSIGISKHNNVAYVMTGTFENPFSGSGADYIFEKQEGKWRFVRRKIWIS
jgi:hypothetical protein